MFHRLWDFSKAVGRHWSALVTGGVVIGLMSIWQGTGHSIPPTVYWLVAMIALFVACFKAWEAERKAKEAAITQKAPSRLQETFPTKQWTALYAEKKRLEDALDAELEILQGLEPKLISGMQPDDPYAFYMSESQENEYQKVSRRIERIKEELETVKQKWKAEP